MTRKNVIVRRNSSRVVCCLHSRTPDHRPSHSFFLSPIVLQHLSCIPPFKHPKTKTKKAESLCYGLLVPCDVATAQTRGHFYHRRRHRSVAVHKPQVAQSGTLPHRRKGAGGEYFAVLKFQFLQPRTQLQRCQVGVALHACRDLRQQRELGKRF